MPPRAHATAYDDSERCTRYALPFRALQGLLDSWNEVIQLGNECEAARFTPAQLPLVMTSFQQMLSESMERRTERTSSAEADELDEEEQVGSPALAPSP